MRTPIALDSERIEFTGRHAHLLAGGDAKIDVNVSYLAVFDRAKSGRPSVSDLHFRGNDLTARLECETPPLEAVSHTVHDALSVVEFNPVGFLSRAT